ncbi:hypothetical protein [Neisseria polysaccharea]|uniref:hypothetical protein n=1 Tax=Neisseria polysaccharea TaxID=489 RepID=UPI0027E1725B|nr:hypothetical protein [Neisseria polysaccharea]
MPSEIPDRISDGILLLSGTIFWSDIVGSLTFPLLPPKARGDGTPCRCGIKYTLENRNKPIFGRQID